MSTVMTRRNAIMAGGTAVAAVAACAVANAAGEAAADRDAELIALERKYWDVTAEEGTTENEYDAALYAAKPERPDALYVPGFRYEPAGFAEHPDDPRAPFRTPREINEFFTHTAPALGCDPQKNAAMHKDTLAAFEKYEAACEAAENDPHVSELRRRADALAHHAAEIRERIFLTPAAGPAGLAVKLRMATGALWEPSLRNDFRNGECADMEQAGALSALLDCERLSGVPYPTDTMEA